MWKFPKGGLPRILIASIPKIVNGNIADYGSKMGYIILGGMLWDAKWHAGAVSGHERARRGHKRANIYDKLQF